MFTRRRFVQGLSGGALLLAHGRGRALAAGNAPTELIGPDFHLTIDHLPVNYTGAARRAVAVNGQVPAPLLRMRQGDTVAMRVTNNLRERTSIHWHGLIVPADMDGVPGSVFHGIAPGSTFTYRFKVNQSGTYWYHAHSRFQEQIGLYGPIVVERRARRTTREPIASTRAAVRLDRSRSRAHLRHAQAPERLLQLRQTHGRATSSPTCARRVSPPRSTDRQHVGRDAHEPHRSRRRHRLRLHLSNERRPARRATGPACSNPASACGCASSTARP